MTRRKLAAAEQLAEVAALIGEPARAAMLGLLMDGRSHTPTELAASADVTAATASGHLSKLLGRKLVAVNTQGRHRYYRLATPEVAKMLERIMVVAGRSAPVLRLSQRVPPELREARTCYDHLAGRLGVAITDTFVKSGAVVFNDEAAELTPAGAALLERMNIDIVAAQPASRRILCRPCLDWSERRPHIAGVLGKAVLHKLLSVGWIERAADSRAIIVTRAGQTALARDFGYSSTPSQGAMSRARQTRTRSIPP